MSESTGTLWKILGDNAPVAVVFYSTPAARERLLELARLLNPAERNLRRITNVEDAFQDLDAILLLTPDDEEEAVLTLDGRRDWLGKRTAPVVLFLLAGGSAERRLREDAAGLESWLNAMEYDPERVPPVDIAAERLRFKEQTGSWPEEWLADWRRGRFADTTENNFLSHRAAFLELPDEP